MTESDVPASTNPANVTSLALALNDFPGLQRGADQASRSAQRTYLLLQRLYLGSLVLGSILGASTGLGLKDWNSVIYTTTACLFGVGALLLGVIRSRQDDKAWFDGRAIAESVKTATWRFMTKAPPFQADVDEPERRFISELGEIRKARPQFGKRLAELLDGNATAITDAMRRIRAANLKDRKRTYLDSRLRDQKKWYASKGRDHALNGSRWFVATVVLQFAALVTAIIQAKLGGLPVNILAIITTSAAAVAAWSQMKRYDELAQAYALAAYELEEIESLATNVTTESQFAQLVEQAEEACSREHTMWAARRDTRLARSPTSESRV